MNSFHHGGRLGDIVYALYTVKALGGGEIYISDFQQGNWDMQKAESILPLLKYQSYITDARFVQYFQVDYGMTKPGGPIFTHNLHDAEEDNNPQDFPEWRGPNWPGNVHLAKRYAHHFGIEWKPNEPWLTAPVESGHHVSFHAPMRRVTDKKTLIEVIDGLVNLGIRTTIIDPDNEWGMMFNQATRDGMVQIAHPKDMIEAAMIINSSKVFFGAVSSCHAIAEGLGKTRIVQQAEGCDNVNSTHVINGYESQTVIDMIKGYCDHATV